MAAFSRYRTRYFSHVVTSVVVGACLAILPAACQQNEDNVEGAAQILKETTREIKIEWKADWLAAKRNNDKVIAENELRIIELRKEVNNVDARSQAKYIPRINDLERRNNELRDRVNTYKDQGDKKWQEFKKDVRRDMADLKSSLKIITIKRS